MQRKSPSSQSSETLYTFQFSFLFHDFDYIRQKKANNSAVVNPMGYTKLHGDTHMILVQFSVCKLLKNSNDAKR